MYFTANWLSEFFYFRDDGHIFLHLSWELKGDILCPYGFWFERFKLYHRSKAKFTSLAKQINWNQLFVVILVSP